jgi:glutaredoxin
MPCVAAREFLSHKNVDFEYIDIGDLDDPMVTIRAITGGHVATPVVVIDDEFIVGFDPDWLEARLAPPTR